MRLSAAITMIALVILTSSAVSAQEGPEGSSADAGKRQFFAGLLAEGRNMAENGYYYEACVAFNGILERGEPV